MADAKTLLRDALGQGPVRCGYDKRNPAKAEPNTVWAAALEAAVSWRTLNRAKAELKIAAFKQQFTGHWMWELPGAEAGCQLPQKEVLQE